MATEEVKVLFSTNVGSHIWTMNHPGSDVDLFVAYQAPSTDFLTGRAHDRSHHSIQGKDDRSSHEIGKVVEEVLKGNVNFLWGVFSPIQISDEGNVLEGLIALARKNLSRQCFNSINGLGVHNYKKYVESGKDTSQKRCNIIARTLRFGITLLRQGEFEFKPVRDVKPEDIPKLLEEIQAAEKESCLPEHPTARDEFYAWLLDLRVRDLNERDVV